jgi:hypothetical protein
MIDSPTLAVQASNGDWMLLHTVHGEPKVDDSRKYAKDAKFVSNPKLIDYMPLGNTL